jgi:putative ABC transport system permease protein
MGLGIGFGVFLFFFTFYHRAHRTDKFHKEADRIYSVVQVFYSGSEGEQHSAYIPYPLIPVLKNEIPEIEDVTRFFMPGRMVVKHEVNKFFESAILFVDPNFLSFFTFEILEGNPQTLLSKPNSVVLTASMAKKYFGDESPLGKVLTLSNDRDVVVTGIVEDLVKVETLSSIHFEFLVPLEMAQTLFGSMENWETNTQTGFVRLLKGSKPSGLDKKLEEIRQRYFGNTPESPTRLYLFPLIELNFYAPHIQKYCGNTHILAYNVFFVMGLLFLIIVSFNYINLSTARYTERFKEIGIRKVVGANRKQLIKQFLSESVLMAIVALPIAVLVYDISCSWFLSRVRISFDLSFWSSPTIIIALIIAAISTGVLAGAYPSFLLSSFNPVQVFKGMENTGRGRGRLRKMLVVFQFSVSAILIVLAIVWQKQTQFVYRVDLGYNRKGVLAIPVSGEAKKSLHLLKRKIEGHSDVESVSASSGLPGHWRVSANVIPEGISKDEPWRMQIYGFDTDFADALDMQIVSGRSFSNDFNDETSFIINQLAANRLGWDNPIGKELTVGDKKGSVIGVIKNFNFSKLFYPIGPSVLYLEKESLNYMLVKVSSIEKISSIVEYIKSSWNVFAPDVPFEFTELDDYWNRVYFTETKLATEIMGSIGIIAIFFSCLGLLGLASYSVRRRTKEIGIRKVLGASEAGILVLVGRDFLKLVALSNLIALPIAYLASKSLLDFAYTLRISISPDIFIVTVFIALMAAISAVVSTALKAARSNPVDSLRHE